MRNLGQQLKLAATETPLIRDYEWRGGREQPAAGVLAVRTDLGKNGDQAI
jgi:hypothetical protein